MTKTQELLSKIAAGTHRICQHSHSVNRWVPSLGEWVTDYKWRSNVISRAAVALKYGQQPLRAKLCTPVSVEDASRLLANT